MGDPVKISDLAISMIRLSGLIENQDIEIKQTGLRPGEKLYEELLTDKENLKRSHNDLIYIADKEKFNKEKINQIEDLIELCHKGGTSIDIVKLMKKIVPEYISLNSSYESLDKKNIQ
jgi:FlaA1/EpsC-like NDP-sugar epimerase